MSSESDRDPNSAQSVIAAGDELLTLVGDAALLVQQITEIDNSSPLPGQKAQSRQRLCDQNVQVRIKGRHLALERIDRKDGLCRRKPYYGRDLCARTNHVGVNLGGYDLIKPGSEQT